jgi:ParB family chromosome partitioning protein
MRRARAAAVARRRLVTPDAGEIARRRAEAAGDARTRPAPPVAQVAGETADAHGRAFGEAVAKANELAEAEAGGLVLRSLSLDSIDTTHLIRDRLADDAAAMAELKRSIRQHGLRTAIEVTPLPEPSGRYGLISGWRRLLALRELHRETDDPAFERVKAVVVTPASPKAAYVAMVEENEVRADLSYYERGRIAVVTAGQGLFADVAAAVETLFAAASPAKRSKIRSFAAIHDELGAALRFPTAVGERLGLRLADALKQGHSDGLRTALEALPSDVDAETEQAQLSALLDRLERNRDTAAHPRRRGRPKRVARATVVDLNPGIRLERRADADGIELRLAGPQLTEAQAEAAIELLRRLFADDAADGPGAG